MELESLIIGNTGISGSITGLGIEYIPKLEYLSLSNNRFMGPIKVNLENKSQLKMLNLSNNQFTGPLDNLIPSRAMRTLDLSSNLLTGSVPFSVYENCHEMTTFLLRYNNLEGDFTGRLSKQVKNVDISYNKFSSSLPGKYEQLIFHD